MMPAKFHEIPSMGLQDIKETKRYGRTDARLMDGQRENSIIIIIIIMTLFKGEAQLDKSNLP